MSEAGSERAVLLEQLAGYLAWEEELGGSSIPSAESSLPSRVAAVQAEAAQPSVLQSSAVTPPPAVRQKEVATLHEDRAPSQSHPGTAPVPREELRHRLALIDEQVRSCTRCELHKGRTHTVFARGNPEAKLVFVGEGPGQEEDRTGQPFVGAAGQLLDKMVAAMGLGREEVYICNVVKCRPPGNRTPLPTEAGACASFLHGQLDLIRPQVIVALGRCAAENMGLVEGGGWRGRWGRYREFDVMPTYHPAFLLRSPEYKRPVWEDLQRVMAKLKANP